MARADDLRVARRLVVLALVLTVFGFVGNGAFWLWQDIFITMRRPTRHPDVPVTADPQNPSSSRPGLVRLPSESLTWQRPLRLPRRLRGLPTRLALPEPGLTYRPS